MFVQVSSPARRKTYDAQDLRRIPARELDNLVRDPSSRQRGHSSAETHDAERRLVADAQLKALLSSERLPAQRDSHGVPPLRKSYGIAYITPGGADRQAPSSTPAAGLPDP